MEQTRQQISEEMVEDWNRKYPPGTPVQIRKDGGELMETKTRSMAEVLSCGAAVIWVEGVRGCYALYRITPVVKIESVKVAVRDE